LLTASLKSAVSITDRQFAALLREGSFVRIAYSYMACLAAGTVLGLLFGDRLFPDLEALFGDPVTDVFLGLAGMVLAAVAYEAVVAFLRPER
jgi:hypothetical protein